MNQAAGISVCPDCGRALLGPPAIWPAETPAWIGRWFSRWLRERDLRQIAFYLACVPLLIGLPVASIAIFGMLFWKNPTRMLARRWSSVLVVALLNIAVSIYALTHLSDLFWNVGIEGLRSIWDILLPRPPIPAGIEPVPV